MSTGASNARGKSKQDYATPPDFMAAVTARMGPLSTDLAAHAGNFKCPHYYTEEQDSLKQSWHHLFGALWLNPPFDKIAPWAEKCKKESELGATILFLTPASVGSNWFRDYVYGTAFVLALNGRICFDPTNPTWGFPKDCMLSCFGVERPGFEVWDWRVK